MPIRKLCHDGQSQSLLLPTSLVSNAAGVTAARLQNQISIVEPSDSIALQTTWRLGGSNAVTNKRSGDDVGKPAAQRYCQQTACVDRKGRWRQLAVNTTIPVGLQNIPSTHRSTSIYLPIMFHADSKHQYSRAGRRHDADHSSSANSRTPLRPTRQHTGSPVQQRSDSFTKAKGNGHHHHHLHVHDLRFKERIRHFTWTWFTMTVRHSSRFTPSNYDAVRLC